MTNTLEGYKLVPREETEEMQRNGFHARDEYERMRRDREFPRPSLLSFCYDAMLSAYPDAPTEALREVVEAAIILRTNARIIPDPGMEGAADCWAVPLDDVDNLGNALSRLEVALGGKGEGNG